MAIGNEWVTNLFFNELTTSVNLLERVLRQEQDAVRERCRRELESIPEDIRETEDGIGIRGTEREHEIAGEIEQICQNIPRLLMKNMIVGTWSQFESFMTGMVKTRIKAESDLSDEGFRTAGKIREMKDVTEYWREKGLTLPAGWKFVDAVREIRNQIVHDGGARSDIDNVTDPIEQKRHRRTVAIDEFIATWEADGKSGIFYHHGALVLSAEFCREVIAFLFDYVKTAKRLIHVPFSDAALKRRMRANGELCDT